MSQTPAVHIEIFQVASAASLTSPELSEGIPAGGLPPSDWPMGLSVGIFLFLITDGYGRAQSTGGSATWAGGPGLFNKAG